MPKDKKNCAPVDPKDKLFWAVFFETLQACISCVGRLQAFDNSIFLVPHGESVSRSLCVASGDGSIIRVKGMEDVLSPDLDVFGTRMEECAMKVAGGLKKDSGIQIAARVRTCHGFRDLSDFIKYHAPALEEMSTNLNKLSGLCDTVEDMDVPKEYLDAALYVNSEAAALVAPPSRSVQFLKQFDDSSRPKKSSKQDPGQEDGKSHLVKRSKAERNNRGCDAEYCPDAPVKKKIQQKKAKTSGIEVARKLFSTGKMPKNGRTIDKMLIDDGSDLEDYVGTVSTSSSVHNHKGTATGKSRALVGKTKPKANVSESSGDEQANPQNDVEPSGSSDSEEEPASKKAKPFRKPKAPVVSEKEPVPSKKGAKPLRKPKGPQESDDEPEIVLKNRGPKYMDPKEIDAIIRKHQSQLTSGERTPPVGHTPPLQKGTIHATPPHAKAAEKKVSPSSSDEDDSEDSDVPDGKGGAVDIAKRQESNNGAATKRKRADGNKENAEGEGSSDEEQAQGVAKESVPDKKDVALECAESAQSVLGDKACAVDKDDGQDSSSGDELDVPAKAGALLFD